MAAGKTIAAAQDGWLVGEDEAGQGLRPPIARTWARRGHTPTVRVPTSGHGRVNIAGLVCYRPGHRSRMIYRIRVCHGRRGEPKAFTWPDYRDLLQAAHQELGGPIVLCWDNLSVHGVPPLRGVPRRAHRLADRGPVPASLAGSEPGRGPVGDAQGPTWPTSRRRTSITWPASSSDA